MMTVKRYAVGETKCADEGTALNLSDDKGAVIVLEFNSKLTSRAEINELGRSLETMGLTAVEIHTGGW